VRRFGNFIGEEVESDEASEAGVDAGDYVYDDAASEGAAGAQGQELMEIDGRSLTCATVEASS
jgi:U5 small nuclear ribonucleoprotein component